MALHPVPGKNEPVAAGDGGAGAVEAVYELREAAVEHGKAIAETERDRTPEARDHLLETALELESKTVAALDEFSDED